MRRLWLVDGNNVMGSRPDGWWRDRPRALSALLDEIIRWREATRDDVVLVADGSPSAMVPDGTRYGVEVLYANSTARDAADDVIVARASSHADDDTSIVVVTSDRKLASRVADVGAEIEGASAFLARLADIETRRADRAVLSEFGIDESALLGRGGEARVFAIDGERVLRLPHPGSGREWIDHRIDLLHAVARSSWRVALPEVLEVREISDRVVLVERRLPGRDALHVLGEPKTDRGALVRDHLDVSDAIAQLPCPTGSFGELAGRHAIVTSSFEAWAVERLTASLRVGGEEFGRVDPVALTADVVASLAVDTGVAPCLVHLDAFLGNMLADGDRITALLDFGPMTLGGVRGLDPMVSVAYLAPEITPTAVDSDRAAARAWAEARGLAAAIEPVERWIAAYWTGAPDDERLREWCIRILRR